MQVFGRITRRARWALPMVALLASLGVATSASAKGHHKASRAAKHVSVAFIYSDYTQDPMQEMALGAKAAGQYYSKNVKFTEAGTNGIQGSVEVQNMTVAEKTAPNGIAVENLTPTEFTRPEAQATSSGIPIIAVDTAPTPGSGVNTFVGNSNHQLGAAIMKALLPKIPKHKKGYVLIGQDIPGLPVLAQRIDGMVAVLKKARPEVTPIQFDSKQSASDNAAAWVAELAAKPDPLACMSPGAEDAISIMAAERSTHKHYVIGQADIGNGPLLGVKEGKVAALVSPEHWLKGYVAEALLIKHAQTGAPIPKGWFNPGLLVITKKNVNQIIARQKNAKSRYEWFKKEANREVATAAQHMKPLKDAN